MARVCGCVRERVTYWPPTHTTRDTAPLLGDAGQFCTTFFHVLPCTEFGIAEHVCLRGNARDCRHQCVTVVARLQKAEPSANGSVIDRATRYTTCRTRQNEAVHAEEFVVNDPELLVPGARITIYGQIQPCHHSSGTDASSLGALSCTELILRWLAEKLTPLGITLRIQCANLYKAMWSFRAEEPGQLPKDKSYTRTIVRAREGLNLLVGAGIRVSSIDRDG